MNQLRSIASAILDKVDKLLTTEPVRLIGYSAAVIIYFVGNFLASRGYFNVHLTFDQSVGAAFGAIGTLIILVESARRFVVSPQTYIEDLADEAAAAHEAAHLEERFRALYNSVKADAATTQPDTITRVGSAKPANSSGKLD